MVGVSPEVYEFFRLVVHLDGCSTLSMAGALGIYFVPKHMILVSSSDTVRQNAAHTAMITSIIFLS